MVNRKENRRKRSVYTRYNKCNVRVLFVNLSEPRLSEANEEKSSMKFAIPLRAILKFNISAIKVKRFNAVQRHDLELITILAFHTYI